MIKMAVVFMAEDINMYKSISSLVIAPLIALILLTIGQAQAEPKYAAKVPESVTTPDVVETSTLGKLKFFDGMPVTIIGHPPNS